jgi:hypothetical protein
MENRIKRMLPLLNERQKRLFLASEALSYGPGGISKVSHISGASRNTIKAGIKEHKAGANTGDYVRKPNGGRPFIETNNPLIADKIREIVEPKTFGNPQKPLAYTTESLRKISNKLSTQQGLKISHTTVGKILESMGYSKQTNQKMLQVGEPHPDRNSQFEHINQTAQNYLAKGIPVISVDTKKKELIGNFKNPGREYRTKSNPRKVFDHDFLLEELGKISPYGVYNVNENVGFVNVGVSHDTAEFAVESISRWWETVGKHTFLDAKMLYVTADCGGSNGYRSRMWKYQLQEFVDRTGLVVEVSHFPPGASKWNKVEHRLFCYISKSGAGQSLVDVQTAVDLIGSTQTTTGLRVVCVRDDSDYELAKKVSDEDFATINIETIGAFETWNYRISPNICGQVIS